MSEKEPSLTSSVLSEMGVILRLSGRAPSTSSPAQAAEALVRHAARTLADCARRLGLGSLPRLARDVFVLAVELVRQAGARREPEPPPHADDTAAGIPRKFDLGGPVERPTEPEHIPWGYGRDRVTAMVVDPDRLFVYWEATDEAMERTRQALGAGGARAWLNLRVYDVTGRIFDGTNAHGFFDQGVARTDRQWFFDVGKPTSTAVVDLGLRSPDGDFVRIARSGRADFPRRDPAPPGPVEWLTVRSVGADGTTPADHRPAERGALPLTVPSAAGGAPRDWDIRRTHTAGAEWALRDTVGWDGPAGDTTWEEGPLPNAVEPPAYVEQRFAGTESVHAEDGGGVRVVSGPWRVVIRGIGGWAARRVLGVWEVYRATAQPNLRHATVDAGRVRAWRADGASEERLGGASELFRRGASERRYAGASERRYGGGSERTLPFPES